MCKIGKKCFFLNLYITIYLKSPLGDFKKGEKGGMKDELYREKFNFVEMKNGIKIYLENGRKQNSHIQN